MTKEALITLADELRIHNQTDDGRTEFTPDHLLVLADFCASQDPSFNRRGWIDYITGEGGQGNELIFVEPDSTLTPAATSKDKPVARVNRDQGQR